MLTHVSLKSRLLAWAALLACLTGPRVSHADPFDPHMVPADAKWVVHADVDAARDSKSFEAVWDRLLSDGTAQAKFDQLEQMTGMNIPNDVHDVTLFGKEAGDEAGVIVLHGKIDKNKTLQTLQFAKDYASTPFGNYQVMGWFDTDKNVKMYGAFHDDDHVIIGRTEKNIELALDTIDGKSPAIKPDSVLVSGVKPQLLAYVAAKDVPQLQGKGPKSNPVFAAVDSAWISLSEKDDVVTLRAELSSSNTDDASAVNDMLNGFRGMLRMAARSEDNPNPVAKAVVAAGKSFTASLKDNTVSVEWPIQVDQMQSIINAVAAQKAGKN
jgi:hypothetical protein